METTTLGRTGITVSRLGYGGAPAGLTNYLGKYDPEKAEQREGVLAALETAVDKGITYFDTAADYGAGASERIFGEALEGLEDKVFLATKISNRTSVRESVENSLKNLRRDSLDLAQLHGTVYTPKAADAILTPGGALDQLCKLRDEGLIQNIGFTSEANNCAVYRFIADGRFDTMQIQYSLLYQHPYDPVRPFGSMFEAEAQKMGIMTMRTLTSGLLQKWIRMVSSDNTHEYTVDLLQFVLSNPLVDVALVGMRTVDEVIANVAVCENMADRIDLDELHRRYV